MQNSQSRNFETRQLQFKDLKDSSFELLSSNSSENLAIIWEEIVKNSPSSGFMQSLAWANFKINQGYRVIHTGLFQNEKLIGGAIGYLPERTNGQGIISIPEGPVLDFSDESVRTEGLSLIVKDFESIASKYGAMALRIEPKLTPPVERYMRDFGRAPVDLLPNETLYLDLQKQDAELLAAMHHKCRYNIRLSQKKGVYIEEYTDTSALVEFYPAFIEAAQRDDFFAEPRSFFDGLCDALCPSGMARLFIAKHENDVLGGLLMLTYGKKATFLYGGITNSKRQLMAGYALQWQAIQRARELGCTSYDFYGYTEHQNENHAYANFSRFKKQFGGTVEKYIGAHDHFFLDRLADVVIKAINQISREGEKAII